MLRRCALLGVVERHRSSKSVALPEVIPPQAGEILLVGTRQVGDISHFTDAKMIQDVGPFTDQPCSEGIVRSG